MVSYNTPAPKRVTFYRNGDKNFAGHKLLVTGQRYRTWESLLAELSKKLESGVHRIYALADKSPVQSVADLVDGEAYVCAGQERMKNINYLGIDKKTWDAGKTPKHGQLDSLGFKPTAKAETFPKRKRVPRIAHEVKANANVVVFYRNGDVTHRGARILLNSKNTSSMDRILDMVSDKIEIVGGVNALYTVEGTKIRDPSELLDIKEVIAAGTERFRGDKLPHRLTTANPKPMGSAHQALPPIQTAKSESATTVTGRSYAESRGVKSFPMLPPVGSSLQQPAGHLSRFSRRQSEDEEDEQETEDDERHSTQPSDDGRHEPMGSHDDEEDEAEDEDDGEDGDSFDPNGPLLGATSKSTTSTRGSTPFPGTAADRNTTRATPGPSQLHEDVVLSKIEDDHVLLQHKMETERQRQKSRLQLRIAERRAGGKVSPPGHTTSHDEEDTAERAASRNSRTPIREVQEDSPELDAAPAADDEEAGDENQKEPEQTSEPDEMQPQPRSPPSEPVSIFGVGLDEAPPSDDDEDFRTFTMMDFRRIAFMWMGKKDPQPQPRRRKFNKIEAVAARVIQAWYRKVKYGVDMPRPDTRALMRLSSARSQRSGTDGLAGRPKHSVATPPTQRKPTTPRSPRQPPRSPAAAHKLSALRAPKAQQPPPKTPEERQQLLVADGAGALDPAGTKARAEQRMSTPRPRPPKKTAGSNVSGDKLQNEDQPQRPAAAVVPDTTDEIPLAQRKQHQDQAAKEQAEFELLERLTGADKDVTPRDSLEEPDTAKEDIAPAPEPRATPAKATSVAKPTTPKQAVPLSKRRKQSFVTPDLTVSPSMLALLENKAATKIQAVFKGNHARHMVEQEYGKKFSAGKERLRPGARRRAEPAKPAAGKAAKASKPESYSSYGIVDEKAVQTMYEFGEQLGDGNFAIVKTCKRKEDGQEFAVKIIDKKKIQGDRERTMIRQEIATMRSISHSNCISLHDVYETNDTLYLIVELCPGGDLFDRVVAKGHFSEADASRLIRSLATALKYLHSKNIVHRDLKPENCLVAQDEEGNDVIKLGDFGLSTVVDKPLHQICGTPTYVAPEIIREDSPGYGVQIDCWAVGVIAYILLCGFPPFASSSKNQKDLFDKIRAGNFSFPDRYWGGISDSARHLISSLLKVNPAERYTADQILDHPWVSGQTARSDDLPVITELLKHFPAKRKWKNAVTKLAAVRHFDSGNNIN